MTETSTFQREERYIVIKRKHLTERQEDEVRRLLSAEEIGTVECVVVESDWPEHEKVWQMIERRVTGLASQSLSTDEEVRRLRAVIRDMLDGRKGARDAARTALQSKDTPSHDG